MLVVHGLLVTAVAALVNELGWLVVPTCCCRSVHLLLVHVILLLQLLHAVGFGHLACICIWTLLATSLRLLHHQFEHLELIFLHCSHMRHLLLVDLLILILHAAVAAC